MFGRDGPELIGRPISELIELPPGASLETIGRARIAARRPDGAELPAELTVTRTSERPPRYTAWIRDLTGTDASERLRKETCSSSGRWSASSAAGSGFRQRASCSGPTTSTGSSGTRRVRSSRRRSLSSPSPPRRPRTRAAGGRRRLREVGRLHPAGVPHHAPRRQQSRPASVAGRGGGARRPTVAPGGLRAGRDRSAGADREISAHVAVAHALATWSSLEEDAARLLRDLARSIEFTAGALWAPDDDVLVAHAYLAHRSVEA